jgi:D-alanine-D-alanine ligase
MQKQKIAIIFGGKSGEHDVSIMSAKNVVEAIDRDLFNIKLVYVDRLGKFSLVPDMVSIKNGTTVNMQFWQNVDVAFPVMHGPNCEDGSMQGFLKTLGVRCVGPSVLGSALGMDKDVQKQLLRANGLEVTDWIALRDYDFNLDKLQEVKNSIDKDFKYPVFIKPANMGSSVGVSKVDNASDLEKAIKEAFSHDSKILIEKLVLGREIECAVLGNFPDIVTSGLGEVVSQNGHDFYDYNAKYIDDTGSQVLLPAPNISEEKLTEMQTISKVVFKVLGCEGLSRVDMFLCSDGRVLVNEINTLPGFTNISMYPKLMMLSGISYKDLITQIIKLAK